MQAHPRARLISLLAALALFLATTAYLSHVHHASGGSAEGRCCGLCLQLTGTAGAQPRSAVALPARSAPARLAVTSTGRLPARHAARAHRSRAPPAIVVI